MNTPTRKKTVTKTKTTTGTTKSASPRGSAAIAKIKEQIAIQKYEYYKSNRATLPSDIREHSEKITEMMESGMSAELAFNEAIKLCFDQVT
jgi:predicted ATP-dependent Lon-type protease